MFTIKTYSNPFYPSHSAAQLLDKPDCPKVLLNKTYAVVSLALAEEGLRPTT
jgi:hypothetical protein